MELNKIIVALANLASEADDQVGYLEGLGLPGYNYAGWGPDLRNVDELALEFEDALLPREMLVERGELTTYQNEQLIELDSTLNAFSGQEYAELWTVEALRVRPEWNMVREKARNCLALLKGQPN